MSYSQHQVFNEVIDIDGNRATGLWYFHCPTNFTEASSLGKATSGLAMGRYQEEYVREGGVWKWRKIIALLDVFAEGNAPWAGAMQLLSNPAR